MVNAVKGDRPLKAESVCKEGTISAKPRISGLQARVAPTWHANCDNAGRQGVKGPHQPLGVELRLTSSATATSWICKVYSAFLGTGRDANIVGHVCNTTNLS